MFPQRTHPARSARYGALEPYLYLLPAVVFLLVTFIYPIIQILRLSLIKTDQASLPTFSLDFYKLVLSDRIFWRSAANNGQLMLSVPLMTVVGLIIAILLFERVRGWRIYRSVIFLPYILAIPTVATTFVYLLGREGIVNSLLAAGGLGFLAQDWLGNQALVIPSISTLIIYRELGFGVVLFLAKLMSLDKEILEAAEIDGANWWQKHLYVTLPQLAFVIEFFIVVEVITMLSWVFAYIYSSTQGGPGFASHVMEFYLWKHGFYYRSPGMAAATAVLLLGVTTALIVMQMRFRRYSLEEA
jgi:ABC-type sugar transport system permease subunit